jgi:hypothetical protein
MPEDTTEQDVCAAFTMKIDMVITSKDGIVVYRRRGCGVKCP